MSFLNQVQLIGNLGNDPEVICTEGKKLLAKIQLATSENWKQGEERASHTEWHHVVFYNGLVELAEKYLKKGDKVFIQGKLRTNKWQDKNGANHYITEIIAKELKFLEKKSAAGQEEAE